MKQKKIIVGYQVEIKPQGERFYNEYAGFYFTKEQAKTRLKKLVLLDGDQARIKTICAI